MGANAIHQRYDSLAQAQIAQLKAQYEMDAAGYRKQLDSAPAQYQALRNEAYVNHALMERSRREHMANLGLSGAGGTSQSLEQRNTGRLLGMLGMLGDASRQQQDYTDNVNLALAHLGVQYGADVAGATAASEAQRQAALLEQQRWEAQYAQSQAKSLFDQAYKLYRKRLITRAQFTAMTNIALKKR